MASLLAACDTLDNLLGDESRLQQPLAGERISVLNYSRDLQQDPLLKEADIALSEPIINATAPNRTALQQAGYDNLNAGSLDLAYRSEAGDGNGWESHLIPSPVIADGRLFAIDSLGVISAHDANDIGRILWRIDTSLQEDAPSMAGGGLAYSGGVLYATTAYGSMIALVASDGSLLWRRETDVPIRSAPTAIGGSVYAITIDNQLFAYAARTGKLQWTHRGIKESAVYMGSASPVIENGIVIAAYSSGELFAIRAEDGFPIWSDSLVAAKRTSASAVLTGIAATPLVRDNIVYAISNNGLMVASLLSSGRGVWDLALSSVHTPWIAGDYIIVLTSDNVLLAIRRDDKRIKWTTDLSALYDAPESLRLSSPIIVNSTLMIADAQGRMLLFDPQSGELIGDRDIPSDIMHRPVIANGNMYLMDQDAQLYMYE